MAIDDIVRRIAEDAANEAASTIAAAEEDAATARAEAKARAKADAERAIEHAMALAGRDAESTVANARLAARDAMLAARLEADKEALVQAEQALLSLPDADYAALIARGVAQAARGDESVLLGTSDVERLASCLPSALAAAGAPALVVGGPATVERGVVLQGDRVRAEVSPAAMVEERRAELMTLADRALFGSED